MAPLNEPASVTAFREFAVREFTEAPPLQILGAFFLPLDDRTPPVPVLTSATWH